MVTGKAFTKEELHPLTIFCLNMPGTVQFMTTRRHHPNTAMFKTCPIPMIGME
jgi:hypothetical protein